MMRQRSSAALDPARGSARAMPWGLVASLPAQPEDPSAEVPRRAEACCPWLNDGTAEAPANSTPVTC